ncbi:quinone oxidoreductase PIG3-like isoform X2 [Gigantopelta aegis]|uniref:quinone oxidoreductase PIG3-like isoform X2 n=1 Tax=Gigantopelta aegis TaxID=1735272 RepID=UPI001B887D52|nr:quinone oxidoreductase PIG3-like isoform X2 [Gigantopelta aegis]
MIQWPLLQNMKSCSLILKNLYIQRQRSLFVGVVSPKVMMRAAQFTPGGPDKLYIGDVPVPVPKNNEVLIKVYATAVNRADTLQRKGLYPLPPGASDVLGLEAVGVIEQIGSSVDGGWKLGDRVMALLSGGGNAEYVASPAEQLMPVPDSLDFVTAAAIPEVWLTAYQLLHTIGQVKKGDHVLIHGGGSGVGTAAIQLVKLAHARPIVTAGSEAKLKVARSLGAVAGFNYKQEEFTDKVLNATEGKGVELILDCVGASFYQQNIKCIAVDGTWVVYGLLGGGSINGDILRQLLLKRVTITGTTLRARSLPYKKELVKNFTQQILPRFESGALKTLIHTVLPLDNLAEAHRMMEANENTGKIVIQVSSSEDNQQKQEL